MPDGTSVENPPRFNQWKAVGPNGGDVRAIVVDPSNSNHFYFSTLDGQIYTSTDGGQNWQMLANLDRSQLVLDSMMVDMRDSKTIYVAGHRHTEPGGEPGGFFKSTDGGKNWRESKELKMQSIYSITQSVKNPDMIAAGTQQGVFVSFDSGNKWEKLSNNGAPDLTYVESLVIDPRNTDVIYAGTWYRPYKTTDGGKSWRLISKGMIDDSDVFAINLDPRNPDHIFSSACSGIYESWDAGENWKKVQGIPSQARRTRDILQHPTKQGYIYAATTEGFWMSTDGGTSWSVTTTRQLEINSISVHPEEPEKVYIGTNNYGVMVSNDFGKTFKQINSGFSTRKTSLIVPDVEQPNRFYAATLNTSMGGSFFYVSNDDGMTWQASMKNFPSAAGKQIEVYSILQETTNPNLIFIGTNKGIYRSLDRGASWMAIAAAAKPKAKVAAPRRRGKATATKPAAKTAAPAASAPVSKTTARVAILNGMVRQLIRAQGGMLAATDTAIYRTNDISKGWERISIPSNIARPNQILAIATSPQNANEIWLGTANFGVVGTHDGGLTWHTTTDVPTTYPIAAIEVDPKNADRVYVGTKQTFYTTKNGGKNWERRGGGLPAGEYQSIIINPNDTNEIFTGSALATRDGVFHSSDGGKNWTRVDTKSLNLPSRRIWSLGFDPRNPNVLLVGTHSAGIFRVERTERASLEE